MKYARIKKGRVICRYCGTKFPAIKERRYTASENTGLSAIANNFYYDAFDCPQCGCQNKIGRRLNGAPNKEGGPNE